MVALGGTAQAVAWPNAQASGLARASSRLASSAETPAVSAPEEHVGEVVVGRGDDHERDHSGYSAQAIFAGASATSRTIEPPIITAKHTCIEGTAA